MKFLKYYILLLTFMLIKSLNAQNEPSFFAKILDANYIPAVSHDSNGNKIDSTNTGNSSLDALINSFEIYSNDRVFKSSKKESLKNIYQIVCNNIELMKELQNSYSNIYTRLEDVNGEALVLPNDFGTTGGYTNSNQEELNYIRAQEAWDITTGSQNVIIGISDNSVQTAHEDLINKVQHVYGINNPTIYTGDNQHGSWVASHAAADTNNELGMSSIGYNSSIYSATNNWVVGVDTLSLMPGVKVINTAWTLGNTWQDLFDEVVEDRNVVVVGSAGNWYSSNYIYPASYGNVISVSAIGHETNSWTSIYNNFVEIFEDSHEWNVNGVVGSFQHNDSVDIVAPAYGLLRVDPNNSNVNGYFDRSSGTSYSSPIVSGTIALMFDVNYCIDPKEVETILILTVVRIDHLPQNISYYGKLGAGKLNAFEAVKMAKDMADEYGTVEVKDRVLYRPWFYKLVTAPYEIEMSNNDVSGTSKLKFRARNNIEILSGDYFPDSGGYIDLQIDENLSLNCPIPLTSSSKQMENNSEKDKTESKLNFEIIPTLVTDEDVTIKNLSEEGHKMSTITVYNFFGMEVFKTQKIKSDEVSINLQKLKTGIYVVTVFDSFGNVLHTEKIVKK